MYPTLEIGDHIFVNKFIYGVRIPWTNIKFGSSFASRKRGEVIVFIYPCEPDKDFIKRIVAIEGDTVEVRGNMVYVNGKPRAARARRRRLHATRTSTRSSSAGKSGAARRGIETSTATRTRPSTTRTATRARDAADVTVPTGQRVRHGRQPRQLARLALLGLRAVRAHQGQGDDHLVVARRARGRARQAPVPASCTDGSDGASSSMLRRARADPGLHRRRDLDRQRHPRFSRTQRRAGTSGSRSTTTSSSPVDDKRREYWEYKLEGYPLFARRGRTRRTRRSCGSRSSGACRRW